MVCFFLSGVNLLEVTWVLKPCIRTDLGGVTGLGLVVQPHLGKSWCCRPADSCMLDLLGLNCFRARHDFAYAYVVGSPSIKKYIVLDLTGYLGSK